MSSENSFLSFEEAKKWAVENNIKSGSEWLTYGSRIHKFLPSKPYRTYKENWKGWGDFLQTGRIQTQDIKFLSFEESSKWARLNKIIKSADWINSKNRPKNIPSNPQRTYKEQWKGWADIL